MDRLQILYIAFLLFATPFYYSDSFCEKVVQNLNKIANIIWKYSFGSLATLRTWKEPSNANTKTTTCTDYYLFLGQVQNQVKNLKIYGTHLCDNVKAITEQVTPLQTNQEEKLSDKQEMAFQKLMQYIQSLQASVEEEKSLANLGECNRYSTVIFCYNFNFRVTEILSVYTEIGSIMRQVNDLNVSPLSIKNVPKYLINLAAVQDNLEVFSESLNSILRSCKNQMVK